MIYKNKKINSLILLFNHWLNKKMKDIKILLIIYKKIKIKIMKSIFNF